MRAAGRVVAPRAAISGTPAGYKASQPMLMWEALRQAVDEARPPRTSRPARVSARAGG